MHIHTTLPVLSVLYYKSFGFSSVLLPSPFYIINRLTCFPSQSSLSFIKFIKSFNNI